MLNQNIINTFGVNNVMNWYSTNYVNDFIAKASSLLITTKANNGVEEEDNSNIISRSLPSSWQQANAPHSMEQYFGFVKAYYGQVAYDDILQKYQNASRTYLDSFSINEWHMYGSSRLGIYKTNKNLVTIKFNANLSNTTFSSTTISNTYIATQNYTYFVQERGAKNYELTNHLGNVMVVITDKKLPVCSLGRVSHYQAEVIQATDYSPFGAPLSDRTYSAPNNPYRFGFNGKEKDNETYGEGNAYDFGARIHDPRLGRWLSLDPLQAKYPGLSPYNFTANNPIIFVDPDGKRIALYNKAERQASREIKRELRKTEAGRERINYLISSEEVFHFATTNAVLLNWDASISSGNKIVEGLYNHGSLNSKYTDGKVHSSIIISKGTWALKTIFRVKVE